MPQEVSRLRKIIGWILSGLAAGTIFLGGIRKITEFIVVPVEYLCTIKYDEIAPYLAALEIFCVTLYLIPKTGNIGFFLLCSYSGGIIVAEWAMGFTPVPGIIIAILLYVGTLLRKPELSGLNL